MMQFKIQQHKAHQERYCIKICKQYECSLLEAVKQDEARRRNQDISFQESDVALLEAELLDLLLQNESSASRKEELTEKMNLLGEGNPLRDLYRDELVRIDAIPNRINSTRMNIGKGMKQLEKMRSENVENLQLDCIKAWFKYGYHADVWQGFEHWLPDFVTQQFDESVLA